MQNIRWAICGLGRISKRFLKVLRSVENTEVVACVSSSKERALAYAKKYNIPNAFTYSELIENKGKVDCVYVSTHMNAHGKVVIPFLQAKIPVLCEKSFAVCYDEAKRMIDCAKENNTLLMEAMWTRFLPASLYATEVIKSGEMGKIKRIETAFEVGIGHGPKSRVFNKNVGGGSILDVGIYPITYTHMLLGNPESITAKGRVKNEVDYNCDAEFLYKDGVEVKIRTSVEFMTLKEHYNIYCENGVVKVPSFYGARKVIVKKNNGQKIVKRFERIDGFTYEVRHFNSLIRENAKQSPIMTFEVTLEVMKLVDEVLNKVGVPCSLSR